MFVCTFYAVVLADHLVEMISMWTLVVMLIACHLGLFIVNTFTTKFARSIRAHRTGICHVRGDSGQPRLCRHMP